MNSGRRLSSLAACLALTGCASDAPIRHEDRSRAGDELLYISNRSGDYDIYLLDLKGGATRRLTETDVAEYGLSWSPDGSRIAFGCTRGGNRDIYVMDVSRPEPKRLTYDPADDKAPAWSPDGTQIAFVSKRESERGEIYVMNADGSQVTRLTRNERYEEVPAWSPDGRELAFGAIAPSADGEQTLQVFVMSVASRAERQLTSLPGHNSAPRWSPDGGSIAFYGNVGEGFAGADIFCIEPNGSNLVNLTNDPEPDWQPDWSPDGSRIVFARGPGDPLDIWVMNADGSGRRCVVREAGRDEQPYWRPSAHRGQ